MASKRIAPRLDPDALGAAIAAAHPELEAVREAAGGEAIYLVGGAVRDLLLDRDRADVDLVVVGDAAALAARLGAETVEHERFATAKVKLDDHEIDIATARRETYPRPGALPEVEPADTIEADLGRRDFTINAMAVPLEDEPRLIDPYGGRADLEAGMLRVLHEGSFVDDPTRALRAARYAARYSFKLAPRTAELLRRTDLDTVSAERREAELLLLIGLGETMRVLELLDEWGLERAQPGGIELARKVEELLSSEPWRGVADRHAALLAAVRTPPGDADELPEETPENPSRAVALAAPRDPVELVLARARGAKWLDRYLEEWREVTLEIDGDDLIAAGVPQGPAVGRGLDAALRRKLDGEIAGRGQELETALEAARGSA
jgi:tRNA nucleotidyltransferase (CCA-adding enzyme)